MVHTENWKEKKLDELIETKAIGLVKGSSLQDNSFEYDYVKMHNISNNNSWNPKDIVRVNATDEEIEKFSLQHNDFLFNTRNSYELVGKSCLYQSTSEHPVLFNNNIMRIKFSSELNQRFAAYAFCSKKVSDQLVKMKQGTTGVSGIYYKTLRNLRIKYPSIPEQKRIVALLDEVFADIEQARAKTEQNLKNARELFESYLQQVFSQRGEGWVEKTLGDVCKFENGDRGKNYPSRSNFVESGFAFINAGHIDDGIVDFSKMNYITEKNYDLLSRGKIKKGDILFCLRGSLGKFAVIEDDTPGAIASSLVIVRPHSDLSISFLLHYLRSGLCKSMIEKYAGGAAQPNLGAKDLAKFSISVPPADQQIQTSDNLNRLMSEVESLEFVYSEKLTALDELKQSILQKAFSGELTKKSSLEAAYD